jgi:hypothetical protein
MSDEALRERCRLWAIRTIVITHAQPFPQRMRSAKMVFTESSGARLVLDNDAVIQRARGWCGARGEKRRRIIEYEP